MVDYTIAPNVTVESFTDSRTSGGGVTGRAVEPQVAVPINTRGFARALFLSAIALSIIGAIANLIIYQLADSPNSDLARIVARFDLGHEPSIPAWFSSMLLLANSGVLAMIGYAKRLHQQPYMMHWLVLAIVFLGLSIDEAALFHEMLDTALSRTVQGSGFLLFPWAIAGFSFAAVVFFAYLRFLLHLPHRFARLFIISGAIYVGGAAGMEIFAAAIVDNYGVASIYHTIVQTMEETMEMLGQVLFFYALTEYWAATYGRPAIPTRPQEQCG